MPAGVTMSLAGVVFDLFGTLVSSNPWRRYRPVVSRMAAILGVPDEPFYELFNRTTRLDRELGRFASLEQNLAYVSSQLGANPGSDQLERAAQLRREFMARVLEPRPEAVSTLRRLDEWGLLLGLISDASPEVPALFRRSPLAPLMTVCVFSAEVGKKKPDPEMYRLACEGLAVEASSVVYVGDGGSHELSGAESFGMSAVLLLPEGETFGRDEYRPEAARWQGDRITRLDQLIDLILSRGWIDPG